MGTVISINTNQQDDNPYSVANDNNNPYGQPNVNDDNPFGNDNPFSGGGDDDCPKTGANNFNDNPFASAPQGGTPFGGDKSVSDQMFVNPKVESYNDVGNDHLPTLSSQIKGDNDKPDN